MSVKAEAINYSPINIFMSADPVVKAVIVALFIASLLSWTIMLARFLAIWIEKHRLGALAKHALAATAPAELRDATKWSNCAGARVMIAVCDEWDWSLSNGVRGYDQCRTRMLAVTELGISREAVRLTGATSLLATIGSTAPFVGLFGTVWGIMHSFISIGQTQDTSLAVVAPGIAEALMATAVGLFCAIPAVIGYNRLLFGLGSVEMGWRELAGTVEVALSRQFEILVK